MAQEIEQSNKERLELSRQSNPESNLEIQSPGENEEEMEGEGGLEYGEETNGRKKILLAEALLLNMYVVPIDLAGLLLFFVGLDDFGIIDILTFPVTQLYFRMKGAKANVDLVCSVVELIPYVGALPIKSVGLNVAIYLANHPEKIGKLPFEKSKMV